MKRKLSELKTILVTSEDQKKLGGRRQDEENCEEKE